VIRLPAFSSLLAFDAVARHGSLTSAAAELNVTQPAISRRIAHAEADLGCALIDRSTRPVGLTEQGVLLFDVLRSGLSRLETVVERIRCDVSEDTISISAGSGLAAYWLIPRLPDMQVEFPDAVIGIISQSHSDRNTVGDIQIRFGDGVWPGFETTKILGEEVFPVASPLLLENQVAPMSLDDLEKFQLLGLQENDGQWYDWTTWFPAVGRTAPRRIRSLDFDNYALMVNAALAGQGICLCWSGLLDDFLSSGGLVRVTEQSASSDRGYFVTHREHLPSDSPVRALATWLAQ